MPIIDIIKKKIKFRNLIISDDISMKALRFNISLNTIKAFTAGCDLVLHCNGKINTKKIIFATNGFLKSLGISIQMLIFQTITILLSFLIRCCG